MKMYCAFQTTFRYKIVFNGKCFSPNISLKSSVYFVKHVTMQERPPPQLTVMPKICFHHILLKKRGAIW